MNTQYIRLNMVPAGVLPVMHTSQFDIGRPLGVVVYDGSAEMDLDDYTVTIEATRTDGTPITAAVTTDGNIGAFVTTATMTNKDDLYPAQLVIVDGNSDRVASLPFMVRVVKAAMDENSEAIEEDAPLYQQYNAAIQASIVNVRADLNAEVAAREAAVAAEAATRAAADSTLQGNIGSEASTRASADNSLQAQINQLVAPTGSAPSAAEIENARIGIDNRTYTTLGDAIRTQMTDVKSAMNQKTDNTDKVLAITDPVSIDIAFEQGTISSGGEVYSVSRIRSPYIYIGHLESITFTPGSGYKFETELYTKEKTYKGYLGFTTSARTITPGDGNDHGYYIRILFAKSDNSNIIPSEATGNFTASCNSILYKKYAEIIAKLGYQNTDLSLSSSWDYGTIALNGGISSNNTRIHSALKSVKKGSQLFSLFDNTINAGEYYFEAVMFNMDGTSISASGWKDNVYSIPYDCVLGINARKRDNSTISQSDFNDMVSKIYFTESPVNRAWEFNEYENVKAINHRGWHEAPENTLIAYKQSYKHGFRFVETDIRFTSDGIPVCLHDATINRTGRNADGTEISSTVSISDITYAQALTYDFGIYKGSEYAGTKLPTLAEFCVLCKELDLLPYIDIGSTPMLTKAQIETIVTTVNNNGLSGKTTYLAGMLAYGVWITQKDKFARVGAVTSLNTIFTTYANAFKTGYNSVFMDTQLSEATAERLANAKSSDLPVEIWTINETSDIDSMDSYISGVTSDSINATEYLKNKTYPIGNEFTVPPIAYSRATNITGGYIQKNNETRVHVSFTSNHDGIDTPNMLYGFPAPVGGRVALQCIEENPGDGTIKARACLISGENLYIDEVELGYRYVIDGAYYA